MSIRGEWEDTSPNGERPASIKDAIQELRDIAADPYVADIRTYKGHESNKNIRIKITEGPVVDGEFLEKNMPDLVNAVDAMMQLIEKTGRTQLDQQFYDVVNMAADMLGIKAMDLVDFYTTTIDRSDPQQTKRTPLPLTTSAQVQMLEDIKTELRHLIRKVKGRDFDSMDLDPTRISANMDKPYDYNLSMTAQEIFDGDFEGNDESKVPKYNPFDDEETLISKLEEQFDVIHDLDDQIKKTGRAAPIDQFLATLQYTAYLFGLTNHDSIVHASSVHDLFHAFKIEPGKIGRDQKPETAKSVTSVQQARTKQGINQIFDPNDQRAILNDLSGILLHEALSRRGTPLRNWNPQTSSRFIQHMEGDYPRGPTGL